MDAFLFQSLLKGSTFSMLQSDGTMYLAGLFLRFGVPLGLTIFLAWLLNNLDLSWLNEMRGDSHAEKTVLHQKPQGCWILHKLPLENSSFGDPQDACWKVRVNFEGILPDQCLECDSFKEGILANAA